ncbi:MULTISPECIES: UDP-N-acetylmuramoyl-L-alanyl-D-glutamate--2,6-diaminopimelate ligase [unclassified Actinotalea]|uniref:UDP-N-acetylmuramoyl-L-alanyl-D-glutamate--2, 6-diaminopimelate ligase n=1 Tax=unclassified Actinotalea TaxID=2638618 RepID=UPI001C710B60|nr:MULTISPECIES: UDP-N-acetylmuramoyl-L-alanyl-D-glutamate--2,6-diaminopimelate ligase [unclassified Actinotalea]
MTSPQGRMRPEHRPTRHLTDLAARFGLERAPRGASARGRADDVDVQVTGVAVGSADVLPGDLFVALPGLRSHGARYADAAVAAGAAAVLTDAAGLDLLGAAAQEVPVLVWGPTASPRTLLGELSAWFYDRPAEHLTVVGITGTNGKTTTSYLVDAALRRAHATTAVVGTVELRVGAEAIESPRTTVEAPVLHGLFALMRERGATAVAMEVSSHALALERVGGLEVDVAVFTNLQRDHLDFHGDMEGYFRDKARLFAPGHARRAVVCVDDEWGVRLAAQAQIPVDSVATREDSAGAAVADWRVSEASVGLDGVGSTFVLTGPGGERLEAVSPLPGLVNVSNAAVAIVAAYRAGVPLADAVAGVAGASAVPGRMERVVERGSGLPLCLVDYAHTPDALVLALEAVRPITPGRLVVVFGSDGDRDRGKRPMMGEIAARLADVLVVTDENPRSEPPASIRAAILEGVRAVRPDLADVHEVEPRAEALRTAVRLAGEQDTVIVTGKGHEPTQEIAGVFHRYNDRDVFLEAAAALAVPDTTVPDTTVPDTTVPDVTVLDETAGATVDTVRAGLRELVTRAGTGRSIAVVGTLAGAPPVDELDGVGRLAVRLDVDRLVAVGDAVRAVHTGALQEGSWGEESRVVADAAAAADWLAGELRAGDVVLVTGGGLAPVLDVARGVGR